MGTRSLTVVYSDGDYRLAKYHQWDGYPDGDGIDVLEFIRGLSATDMDKFRRHVGMLVGIADEQLSHLRKSTGAVGEWATLDQSMEFKDRLTQLHRDTGGWQILQYVLDSPDGPVFVENRLEFAADSLFCEYLWLIDLDLNRFEGYRGFNKSPLADSDRFFFLEAKCGSEAYHPVKLVASWPIESLPSRKEFLAAFGETEDS